ncbi:MAG TPA: glycosyltransferase family 2 protein [Bryobacteraceae bacterium]|nr:glycosyltransferase family 2 protein [Bryobacteraceae bacterium]
MAFFALLPCRDEADIIGQCLRHALTWADEIYVFDSGSVDDTWEIVNDAARAEKRIKLVRKQPVFFSETRLRAFMFDRARGAMRDGDWFVRLDADEFHHITPPNFVKMHLRRSETIVYHQYYDFRLLASEVLAWESGHEALADRERPVETRRRHFVPSVYSEPRLCRYRASMRWPDGVSFPFNAGFLARERLPIRHYPHRDPAQLARRVRLRSIMMEDADNRRNWTQPEIHHWVEAEWRKFVAKDSDPDLRYWAPGEELPTYGFTNHLRAPQTRLIQRAVHAFLLPLLDRTRPTFSGESALQLIPDETQRRLVQELGPR